MVEIPNKPRARLHKQICRVLAIIQVLHAKGEMTSTELHLERRSKCCKRTIVRDLDALEAMGYVARVKQFQIVNGRKMGFVCRYSLLLFKLSQEAGKLPEKMRRREL
jgi:predicted DNA-binding transcriptional regulator YafY